MSMKLTLKFLGGCEHLFGDVSVREVDLTQVKMEENSTDDVKATTPDNNSTDEGKSCIWTLRTLLLWLKDSSGFLTGDESLFFSEEDGVRNGLIVIVNECDWELLGYQDCELKNGDIVDFISTLHGG